MVRQRSPWHQTVPVEMGPKGLIPGMQDLDTTDLASQVLTAELEECLAGSPQEQREERAFVGQDERIEFMWKRKDAVEIRHWQERGLAVCDPLGFGEGLTLGAGAIAA